MPGANVQGPPGKSPGDVRGEGGRVSTRVIVCVGSSCHVRGSREILGRFARLLKEHGLEYQVVLEGAFCMERCGEGLNWRVGDEDITSANADEAEAIFRGKVLGLGGRDEGKGDVHSERDAPGELDPSAFAERRGPGRHAGRDPVREPGVPEHVQRRRWGPERAARPGDPAIVLFRPGRRRGGGSWPSGGVSPGAISITGRASSRSRTKAFTAASLWTRRRRRARGGSSRR